MFGVWKQWRQWLVFFATKSLCLQSARGLAPASSPWAGGVRWHWRPGLLREAGESVINHFFSKVFMPPHRALTESTAGEELWKRMLLFRGMGLGYLGDVLFFLFSFFSLA